MAFSWSSLSLWSLLRLTHTLLPRSSVLTFSSVLSCRQSTITLCWAIPGDQQRCTEINVKDLQSWSVWPWWAEALTNPQEQRGKKYARLRWLDLVETELLICLRDSRVDSASTLLLPNFFYFILSLVVFLLFKKSVSAHLLTRRSQKNFLLEFFFYYFFFNIKPLI